jgi:hypothetical protein
MNTKTKDLLKAYNKAINELLVEILLRSGYEYVIFGVHDGKQLFDCEAAEGINFLAGDGYDDGEIITGYWVGGDIGGILVVNEEWFIKPEILKQAVELKVANIDDIFDYYDYMHDAEERRKKVLNFKNWYKLK